MRCAKMIFDAEGAQREMDIYFLCESKSLTAKEGILACNEITYSCATAQDSHLIPLVFNK